MELLDEGRAQGIVIVNNQDGAFTRHRNLFPIDPNWAHVSQRPGDRSLGIVRLPPEHPALRLRLTTR